MHAPQNSFPAACHTIYRPTRSSTWKARNLKIAKNSMITILNCHQVLLCILLLIFTGHKVNECGIYLHESRIQNNSRSFFQSFSSMISSNTNEYGLSDSRLQTKLSSGAQAQLSYQRFPICFVLSQERLYTCILGQQTGAHLFCDCQDCHDLL